MPIPRRLLLFMAVAMLFGCGRSGDELTMHTPRLDIDRELAEDFADLFSDPALVQIELAPNADPARSGLQAVRSGEADLALVSNVEPYDADVNLVVPLYPTVLHIAYRADEPVTDLLPLVTDLTVFAGPPGSSSRAMLETAARRVGIAPEAINYLEEGSCADVLVMFAPVRPEVPGRIGRCGDYRLFSLGSPEDLGTGTTVESVLLWNPSLEPFVIPMGTYGALTPEPVVTLAVDKLLVARRDLPDATIYDLLSEILRLKPALSADHPGLFHQLTENFDTSRSAFALHPGAQDYLLRDEPDVYERYSGVAEVVVTLIIGSVSGLYAVFQIISIRRKNRIDRFYQEVIAIRKGVEEEGTPEARSSAIASLKALQDRAYESMIEEKLAADESFRIFITLSNDTIADLKGDPRGFNS